MKNAIALLLSILGCIAVGLIGSLVTADAIPNWYAFLEKPFFSPPNWLFGPVWTILYTMMSISFFLIWKQGWQKQKNKAALQLFGIQLALNFIWTPIFFGYKSLELALIVIMFMWIAIVLTIRAFYPLSKSAAWLLVPYLLWVSFATLLNASLAFLN